MCAHAGGADSRGNASEREASHGAAQAHARREEDQTAGEQKQVTIDDLRRAGALMRDAPALNGGMQGGSSLKLMHDEDGDEAHEFLEIDAPPGRAR